MEDYRNALPMTTFSKERNSSEVAAALPRRIGISAFVIECAALMLDWQMHRRAGLA